ncbi:multicopper oxidase domain-containing protein [Corynebacterium gerontici]|uniref:Copper-containing nitrite reductase n=1 Tax=Corynebacterium gerontici TaxID=2079234 RepID=A0A3G6IXI1_9CORY|nr:multicopper oxidase domain-containing protein [Corynebacterium gerontici]AZA10481.1 Copper-containing nitrite reductase precursor [Corynebacterium gerontici]
MSDQPFGRFSRAAWHRKASKPVSLWLIALVLVSLVHWAIPNYRWLLIHMFTLGALSNSIMLWSQHFTEKFLHQQLEDDTRPRQLLRFRILNAGIVVTLIGQVAKDVPWHWVLTAIGATVVGLSLAYHAWFLGKQYLRADKTQRFAPCVLAYIASASCLPFGALFGALMAADIGWKDELKFAHLMVNMLGFVGFAAIGTLMLLFPTIWRTKSSGERPKIVLALMVVGVADAVIGGLLGAGPFAGIGVMVFLCGVLIAAFDWAKMIREVAKAPRDRVIFASLSVAIAPLWLLGALIVLAVRCVTASNINEVTLPTMALLIGFAAQLLIGVMSYLLPSNIGGGPAATRTGLAMYDTAGIFRSTLLNVGLGIWLYTDNSWLRVVTSILALGSLAIFAVLTPLAVKAQLGVIRKQREPVEAKARPAWGQATAALAVLALVLASFGGLGSGGQTSTVAAPAAVDATGEVTEINVEVEGMSFVPKVLEVPKGNNLRVNFTNTGDQAHDLKFANGVESGRLQPGESKTLEVGTISEPMLGWCTVAGHRQMGMELEVRPSGEAVAAKQTGGMQHEGTSTSKVTDPKDLNKDLIVNPELKPADGQKVHKVTLDVSEIAMPVSEGHNRGRWTFNGQVMGPTLRGKVGDRFEITLVNNGTMSHSVDFHAGMVSPDEVMRSIEPGESLQYNFTAEHAGAWLYHCGTMPMSLHLSAGMYGALIVDPPDLAPVDHEYFLVQSEVYGLDTSAEDPVDTDKLAANTPDAVVFNGLENQYLAEPWKIKKGETVRIWLVNAGPNDSLSFHIVGSQFHTTYKEGAYLLRDAEGGGASQALDLLAAQGGFVEATFPEAGTYTMVNHQFIDAERGAKGQIIVE